MNGRSIGILACGLVFAVGHWLDVAPQAQGATAATELKPIGKVQLIVGEATIEHTRDVVLQASAPASGNVKQDDPIYLGDVLQTRANSRIGIVFGDGTAFNVLENARMEINEFVYDPRSNANSTLFNLTKGTFTFLAGKVAKTGNMRVETPVGTMGIRGTAPHVEILDDGTVKLTTLVEEYRNAMARSDAPPPRSARRAELAPAIRPLPARNWDRILTICRGC